MKRRSLNRCRFLRMFVAIAVCDSISGITEDGEKRYDELYPLSGMNIGNEILDRQYFSKILNGRPVSFGSGEKIEMDYPAALQPPMPPINTCLPGECCNHDVVNGCFANKEGACCKSEEEGVSEDSKEDSEEAKNAQELETLRDYRRITMPEVGDFHENGTRCVSPEKIVPVTLPNPGNGARLTITGEKLAESMTDILQVFVCGMPCSNVEEIANVDAIGLANENATDDDADTETDAADEEGEEVPCWLDDLKPDSKGNLKPLVHSYLYRHKRHGRVCVTQSTKRPDGTETFTTSCSPSSPPDENAPKIVVEAYASLPLCAFVSGGKIEHETDRETDEDGNLAATSNERRPDDKVKSNGLLSFLSKSPEPCTPTCGACPKNRLSVGPADPEECEKGRLFKCRKECTMCCPMCNAADTSHALGQSFDPTCAESTAVVTGGAKSTFDYSRCVCEVPTSENSSAILPSCEERCSRHGGTAVDEIPDKNAPCMCQSPCVVDDLKDSASCHGESETPVACDMPARPCNSTAIDELIARDDLRVDEDICAKLGGVYANTKNESRVCICIAIERCDEMCTFDAESKSCVARNDVVRRTAHGLIGGELPFLNASWCETACRPRYPSFLFVDGTKTWDADTPEIKEIGECTCSRNCVSDDVDGREDCEVHGEITYAGEDQSETSCSCETIAPISECDDTTSTEEEIDESSEKKEEASDEKDGSEESSSVENPPSSTEERFVAVHNRVNGGEDETQSDKEEESSKVDASETSETEEETQSDKEEESSEVDASETSETEEETTVNDEKDDSVADGVYCYTDPENADVSTRPSPDGIFAVDEDFWKTVELPFDNQKRRPGGTFHESGDGNLPDGWETHLDDKGRRYYYQPSTGISQWGHPGLPKGWSEAVDDEGNSYYWKRGTNTTAWPLGPGREGVVEIDDETTAPCPVGCEQCSDVPMGGFECFAPCAEGYTFEVAPTAPSGPEGQTLGRCTIDDADDSDEAAADEKDSGADEENDADENATGEEERENDEESSDENAEEESNDEDAEEEKEGEDEETNKDAEVSNVVRTLSCVPQAKPDVASATSIKQRIVLLTRSCGNVAIDEGVDFSCSAGDDESSDSSNAEGSHCCAHASSSGGNLCEISKSACELPFAEVADVCCEPLREEDSKQGTCSANERCAPKASRCCASKTENGPQCHVIEVASDSKTTSILDECPDDSFEISVDAVGPCCAFYDNEGEMESACIGGDACVDASAKLGKPVPPPDFGDEYKIPDPPSMEDRPMKRPKRGFFSRFFRRSSRRRKGS